MGVCVCIFVSFSMVHVLRNFFAVMRLNVRITRSFYSLGQPSLVLLYFLTSFLLRFISARPPHTRRKALGATCVFNLITADLSFSLTTDCQDTGFQAIVPSACAFLITSKRKFTVYSSIIVQPFLKKKN